MGTGKMLGFQRPGETMAGKVIVTLEMVTIQRAKNVSVGLRATGRKQTRDISIRSHVGCLHVTKYGSDAVQRYRRVSIEISGLLGVEGLPVIHDWNSFKVFINIPALLSPGK